MLRVVLLCRFEDWKLKFLSEKLFIWLKVLVLLFDKDVDVFNIKYYCDAIDF